MCIAVLINEFALGANVDDSRAASSHIVHNLVRDRLSYSLLVYRHDRLELSEGKNLLDLLDNLVILRGPRLKTAQALYQLAADQETAGITPNIDTLRARVQLQAQQEALIEAQNALEKQRIALARVIGLPVGRSSRW